MRLITLCYQREFWRMLLLLLALILVPTACVLWFMFLTVENERLAVRQRLVDTYSQRLMTASARLDDHWRVTLADLANRPRSTPPEEFADLVRRGICDSVILFDTSGKVVYPGVSAPPVFEEPEGDDWRRARALEYEKKDLPGAAAAYAAIAAGTADPLVAGYALQAQARCVSKDGRAADAVQILTSPQMGAILPILEQERVSLWLAVRTRVLDLLGSPGTPLFREVQTQLAERLNTYGPPSLSAGARLFYMERIAGLTPDARHFDTLEAERLAAETLVAENLSAPDRYSNRYRLLPTKGSRAWSLPSPDGAAIALFRRDTITRLAKEKASLGANEGIDILPPWVQPPQQNLLTLAGAGEFLPDWNWVVTPRGDDLLDETAQRRTLIHLWTALLTIAGVVVLVLFVSYVVLRQMSLANLKNELIATVSHELKTPLTSMRVLVDTLLAGRCATPEVEREYLQLIAKENTRLSRLIEDFLTFSRMERNKRCFELVPVSMRDVVSEAVEAGCERFRMNGCKLDVSVESGLPAVAGDKDALVTVVLNLLDNAYKYTGDDKDIRLHAYASGNEVCVDVKDNGIGLLRRDAKRVFERFYQVDQGLSRRAGGCGLGLSIAKFIVDAHGGTISIMSELGKGSTFTVRFPVEANREH